MFNHGNYTLFKSIQKKFKSSNMPKLPQWAWLHNCCMQLYIYFFVFEDLRFSQCSFQQWPFFITNILFVMPSSKIIFFFYPDGTIYCCGQLWSQNALGVKIIENHCSTMSRSPPYGQHQASITWQSPFIQLTSYIITNHTNK